MGIDSPTKIQDPEIMSHVPGRNNTVNGHQEKDNRNNGRPPSGQSSVNQVQRTSAAASNNANEMSSSEPCTPIAGRRGGRPQSAPMGNLSGLLRTMGDQYLFRSTGKTLQVLGDGLETEYYIRRALSYGDLPHREEGEDADN